MENLPQILHLSARESKPDNEYKWLYVNLVFKVADEYDVISCQTRVKEWSKTTIYEVDDEEDIHNHYLHTSTTFQKVEGDNFSRLVSFNTDPKYDISDKKRTGLALNPFNMLQYIEKFDVFVFREYVEDNVVTRAALSLLENVKENAELTSRFVPFSTFIRCVDTLFNFWD